MGSTVPKWCCPELEPRDLHVMITYCEQLGSPEYTRGQPSSPPFLRTTVLPSPLLPRPQSVMELGSPLQKSPQWSPRVVTAPAQHRPQRASTTENLARSKKRGGKDYGLLVS